MYQVIVFLCCLNAYVNNFTTSDYNKFLIEILNEKIKEKKN